MGALTQDEIYSKQYSELPQPIRQHLNGKGVFGNDIKAIVLVKPSAATKAAALVLKAASWVNRLSGLIIGRQVGEKEFKEAAELTVTKEVISFFGTSAGEITLRAFDLIEGTELAKQAYLVAQGAKNINPPVLAANIVAFALNEELKFIDRKISGLYQGLGTLNPWYPFEKTEAWLLWIKSAPRQGTATSKIMDVRGTIGYYRDLSDGQYKPYFSDVAGTEMLLKRK